MTPSIDRHGEEQRADGAEVIARAVREGQGSEATTLAGAIEVTAEQEGAEGEVAPIVGELRDLYGFTVTTMDEGIGGQYQPGSAAVRLNARVLDISPGQSLQQTAEQIGEIGDHEKFHRDHKHNPTALRNAFAEGPAIVMIGGKEFEATPLIEGITVAATGDRYVSADYRGYKVRIEDAMAAAKLNFQQIVQAIDSRDLTTIDDHGRRRGHAGGSALSPDGTLVPFVPSVGGIAETPLAVPGRI